MIGRVGLFLGSSLALWALSVGVALGIWPEKLQIILLCSSVAIGLCLLPTLATLLWSAWSLKQNPQQLLLAALGGTGVRMFFVLGMGLLLSSSVPLLRENRLIFWLWTLVFYLCTLALETVVILRAAPDASESKNHSTDSASLAR